MGTEAPLSGLARMLGCSVDFLLTLKARFLLRSESMPLTLYNRWLFYPSLACLFELTCEELLLTLTALVFNFNL